MSGYWQDSSATEARIVDGWLDTQDRAEFDNDGRALRILGRMDDVIVLQNGYKLNPFPIEARVLELPWVEDCFLFGSGRKTCVLIIKPRSGASLPTLDAVCEALTTLLPNDASRAIRVVQFSSEPWSAANGLCNFKGGKRRRELEQFYTLLLAKEKTA